MVSESGLPPNFDLIPSVFYRITNGEQTAQIVLADKGIKINEYLTRLPTVVILKCLVDFEHMATESGFVEQLNIAADEVRTQKFDSDKTPQV